MKKIFAIICALCILIPASASACGGIAVKIETGNTYTGSAYVAMEQEQHLMGLLSETEKAEVFAREASGLMCAAWWKTALCGRKACLPIMRSME